MYEDINKSMKEILNCINSITADNKAMSGEEAATILTLTKAVETLCDVRDNHFLNE